jgi:transcriptional regulator with XRE-family HTH domain
MDKEQAKEFGTFLRERREAAGISLRGLADRIGVHKASIARFEQGEVAFPRVDLLTAIAVELKVPLDQMLTNSGYPTTRKLPNLRPYLRTKYGSALSPEGLVEIEAIIRRDLGTSGTAGPVDGEDEH